MKAIKSTHAAPTAPQRQTAISSADTADTADTVDVPVRESAISSTLIRAVRISRSDCRALLNREAGADVDVSLEALVLDALPQEAPSIETLVPESMEPGSMTLESTAPPAPAPVAAVEVLPPEVLAAEVAAVRAQLSASVHVDRAKVERLRGALSTGALKFDPQLIAERIIGQGA